MSNQINWQARAEKAEAALTAKAEEYKYLFGLHSEEQDRNLARAEKAEAALREIAKVATVAWNPELPDKNAWRDIAVERIDIARAALKEQGR